jgi:hypothetical protein
MSLKVSYITVAAGEDHIAAVLNNTSQKTQMDHINFTLCLGIYKGRAVVCVLLCW